MRTLVLLRHAKSDYPPGIPDHDRPLAARGRRDAPAAGAWLAAHCPTPDRVLVSSAQRAQETWALAAPEVGSCGTVVTEPRIYEAAGSTLAALVSNLPSDDRTVVMVGHNPGLEDLAAALVRGGDAQAQRRMREKYPTNGIAVLQSTGEWSDLVHGADLVDFVAPRG